MRYFKELNTDLCIGCGSCARSCPAKVFDMQGGKAVPNRKDDCFGCEVCIDECLEDAITLEERVNA